MPQAWRIVRVNHLAGAMSGDGAARFGGRWNSRGVAMVYASASRALAALELLVHLNPPVFFPVKILGLEFENSLVEYLKTEKSPSEWRTEPPTNATQAIGDQWIREKRSAVLCVPSVIIPEESNYLLNPAHPDFKRVKVGTGRSFSLDPRLLTGSSGGL